MQALPPPTRDRPDILCAVVGLALLAPTIAGGFFEADWGWGWDHLRRIPLGVRLALVAASLLVWFPPGSRWTARAFARIGTALGAGSLRFPILLALAGIATFAAFPIATRIYGDSKYILDDYSPANLAIHLEQMLQFGLLARGRASFVLHEMIARATGLTFEQSYTVVSVLCGGIFLYAHARLAATLPGLSGPTRAAILCLGVVDGGNQVFFGHVENYTLPRLFGALFLIEAVRSLCVSGPVRVRGRALIWFSFAVFFHSQALVLLPTLLLWIARAAAGSRPRMRPLSGGRAVALGIGGVAAVLAVVYAAVGASCYDYIYSGGRPGARQLFLPLTTGCVGLPYLRYTLFSGSHILDFLGSLYSISSPAALLALLLLVGRRVGDDRILILLPSIATAALHNWILNPAIGFPFDWDLMCVLSPPILYTAVFAFVQTREIPKPMPSSLVSLGIGTLVLFGINADRAAVRGRVEDMGVWLHRTYYGGSHYRLSANASTIASPQDQAEARLRALERLRPHAYPDDREVGFLWERLARLQIEQRDYEKALEAYREAVVVEPSRKDRLKPLGYLEAELGDPRASSRILREYLGHAPNDGEAWIFLGNALAVQEDWNGTRDAWERGLQLAPTAPEAPRVREDLRRLREMEGR